MSGRGSRAPLLIVAITITGVVFGADTARSQIIAEQAASAIQDMLVHAQQPGTDLVAGIAGGVTFLVGASGVFGQLQDALNTVWEVEPKPGTRQAVERASSPRRTR
jgi:membrane protein